jgi:outer membrane protein
MIIKKIFLTTVIYILCCSYRVSATTYTLDALLEFGFENAQEIKLVEEEMKKADAQIKEYYGMALPVLEFSSQYQFAPKQFNPLGTAEGTEDMSITELLEESGVSQISESGAFIIGNVLDGMMSGLTPKKHMASIGVSLTQPLFSQGKVLSGIRIARLYNRSLLCKWQDAKMQVKARITKLFYSGLLSEKITAIQENAITLSEETHRLAVLRLQTGNGTELDTLKTRWHLENARIKHQESLKQRRMAFDALIKVCGVPDNVEDMKLEGDFPDDNYSIEMDVALQRVQSENKQIIQLNVSREIQKHLVKIAKKDYLPVVYCGGSLSKITQFNVDEDVVWQDDQRIFIGLSYTLFRGMRRAYSIKQAKATERMVVHGRELAIEGLELATRNAWEDLETSRKNLDQAKSQLALAEKVYSISKKAYEVGQITLLEFQDSEQNLNGARIALNAARFGFHSAAVDLRLLTAEYFFDDQR